MVVPSYRRPVALAQCLRGLAAQADPADEVVVVHRPDDHETIAVVDSSPVGLRTLRAVHEPGVVAAMAVGCSAVRAGVVAFCDDDAIPRPDWIAAIRAAFRHARLGALGGRDRLGPPHPVYPPTESVGLIGGWGRLTGEHHRGAGNPRGVDVLKAVNMAFRAEALAFPTGLRGEGAQVHFELSMCLWARERGWDVVYDPELVVDHHPQQRFDDDRRDWPTPGAISDAAYNYTLSLLTFKPVLAPRRAAYAFAVGDTAAPGLVRAALAIGRRDAMTSRKFLPSQRGMVHALVAFRRGHCVRMTPVLGLIPEDTLPP
ncbi:MAG: glycosyltransferase [Solirubrobacteraceae bacterium]